MKLQVQDEHGNEFETTNIHLGENDLLIIRPMRSLDNSSLGYVSQSVQNAIAHQTPLIVPEWIDIIVVKEKK